MSNPTEETKAETKAPETKAHTTQTQAVLAQVEDFYEQLTANAAKLTKGSIDSSLELATKCRKVALNAAKKAVERLERSEEESDTSKSNAA